MNSGRSEMASGNITSAKSDPTRPRVSLVVRKVGRSSAVPTPGPQWSRGDAAEPQGLGRVLGGDRSGEKRKQDGEPEE
jgi:hypothetical protein